ncbi:MAG: sigma-54 dependent transcriptional regulator [Pseudomonadota bacterium]
MGKLIAIVDDDPVQRRLLDHAVTRMGHSTVLLEGGAEALSHLQAANDVDLVVLDVMMPRIDGLTVLSKLRETGNGVPVIVQTAQGSMDMAVDAMRRGAQDFLVKPVAPERLKVTIDNALKVTALKSVVEGLRKSVSGTLTFDDMIGDSPAMAQVRKLGRRVAGSSIPVLIEGESGVGKEIIAKAIQGESPRAGKPFVTVNCGALPQTLVESILFGHEKGAFTGAERAHRGKFAEAHGGTLFLDEIGELSPEIQVKLLRALQEGEIDPVGAKKPVKTDFRLICATNRDLQVLVSQGAFREDLFYRVNAFPITVPPLRDRREDIAPLAQHFMHRLSLEEGRRSLNAIEADALTILSQHDWPGNVRQLENTIFRAIVLCDGPALRLEDFPQIAQAAGVNLPPMTVDAPPLAADLAPSNAAPLIQGDGALRPLEAVEADVIAHALRHHKGRMTSVARDLGIGRSTLYRKIKEYGLEQSV